MDIKETLHVIYFLFGKSKSLGKKMPFSQLLTLYHSNWINSKQNKVTAKHCQDKERQPFRISCFTEESVRYARPVGQR